MNVFQIVFLAFILISLIRIIKQSRVNLLKPVEVFFWGTIWLAGGIVILFPAITVKLSNFFGIARGVDFIIYTSIIFLYYILYRIYLKLENLSKMIKEITTKIALDKDNEN
ncbi:DUF2304 domain-containing protein [candidate division WWE3 bacterium CG_4_9_14_3_um_filter_34_6]|uniref:DUF2304 domain-containing protein n=1 Tax=candidate division WWE3 bacterium CG_4_9_14_3_um_filter_34_6 TaxID=1975079 RepID=A0A2M7X3M2_UNCKA|nr:MAG: DUF2304 domain-containing protein [candidate division WWE3 bacterium CG_4_9_14_3_um_filter_34_6]